MLRDRRTLLGLLGVTLVSLATVPFLLRADDPELELRRRRIEGMTPAERQHLQRNFSQFQSMDEGKRQELRNFDAAVIADQTGSHGRLAETLRIYDEWLQSVTPHQRDALARESDPARRIAMIRDIVESQRDERIELRMGGRAEEFLGPIPDLSPQDLEAMLALIDSKAGLYLSNPAELEEYQGIRRSLKLFELLAGSGRTIHQVLTDSTMRQLADVITDEETRHQLATLPESERPAPQARRLKLSLALLKALEGELDREYHQKRISPENLSAFFEKLPEDEQDELLSLAPNQFKQQLLGKYVETVWSQNRIKFTQVRQFFQPQRPPPNDPRIREPRDGRPFPPDGRPPPPGRAPD